ncbi:splicing regulator SDE2 [Latimeria chalumnae]|uniref:Replication stress response regulator SDE2 n=1 Tax=Latimeria chalumnae TaxID=7897 RepID=H2ZZC2_LATCH|nr:PREDICTED: protein SDE2 homolog [Latimeria chalumnae]|eukprot:XP_006012508.1 PREDICTED: protein SDE2 homolog [Latimeria chalumnae]
MAVFLRDFASKLLLFPALEGETVWDLIYNYAREQRIPLTDFYVKCNGHLANGDEKLQPGIIYSLEPRLCGGKGGFGSMLRALGAQIEKTTNREACRDLSGRRLRDVNHEKEMAEWIKKQAEREAEKEQKRLERLKRKLAEPKHYFTDPDYEQQCHELSERLEDSVLKGMQASSSTMVSAEGVVSCKRPAEATDKEAKLAKKKCLWMGLEDLEDLEGSGEDENEGDESPSTSGVTSEETGSPAPSCSRETELRSGSDESSGCSVDLSIPIKPPEGQKDQKEVQESLEVENSSADLQIEEVVAEGKDQGNIAGVKQQDTALESRARENSSQNSGSSLLDLMSFNSATELEPLGLESLKSELMVLGLKCGGTLQERAARLFSVRGLARDQIDPVLFAKPAKGKKK